MTPVACCAVAAQARAPELNVGQPVDQLGRGLGVDQLAEEPVGTRIRGGAGVVVDVGVRQHLIDRDRVVLHAVLVELDGGARSRRRGLPVAVSESGSSRSVAAVAPVETPTSTTSGLTQWVMVAVGVAEVDDVDHVLAQLGQLFGRVDGIGRQDRP